MVDVLDIIPIPLDMRLRDLRLRIQRKAPVKSGALYLSWEDPRTVQMKADGSIEIDNPLRYARIQDEGGDIPPYECPPGKVMRAVIDGQVRFFTSRKGFHLPGSQYVSAAVTEWQRSPYGISEPVEWGAKTGGAMGVGELLRLIQMGVEVEKGFSMATAPSTGGVPGAVGVTAIITRPGATSPPQVLEQPYNPPWYLATLMGYKK